MFEVFAIGYAVQEAQERDWKPLNPFQIKTAQPLWRWEWIEPLHHHVDGLLGAGPGNTQYAGRGPAPPNATSAAVLAGVLLKGASSEAILIAASDSAPLNVEMFATAQAVNEAAQGFVHERP
jgi:hypothetical protein